MMHSTGPYNHPYGGIAKDVYVTRALFARTFGYSLSRLDSLPLGMKVGDIIEDGKELCGYLIKGPRGGRHFLITYIEKK